MSINQIIFIASPAIIVLSLIVFYFKGKAALKMFPDISSIHVIYQERFCSGCSMQSWKSKMGGASNVLDIIITDTELWIKAPTVFAGIGKEFDLLHRISLRNIINVHSNNNGVIVNFKNQSGEFKQVFLQLHNPYEFVKIIQDKSQLI